MPAPTRPYTIADRETGAVLLIVDGAISRAEALSTFARQRYEASVATAADVIQHAIRGKVPVESVRPDPEQAAVDAEVALFAHLEALREPAATLRDANDGEGDRPD